MSSDLSFYAPYSKITMQSQSHISASKARTKADRMFSTYCRRQKTENVGTQSMVQAWYDMGAMRAVANAKDANGE
jgi:hypothetical protein